MSENTREELFTLGHQKVLYGKISLKKLKLLILKDLNSVDIKMNDILIKVKVRDCEINFPNEIELNAGNILEIS